MYADQDSSLFPTFRTSVEYQLLKEVDPKNAPVPDLSQRPLLFSRADVAAPSHRPFFLAYPEEMRSPRVLSDDDISSLTYFCVPRQIHKAQMPMYWWGCVTSIPGLMLLVYAITDSPHVTGGWSSPKIIVTFVAGIIFLAASTYVEGWVSKAPLIGPKLFATKHIVPLFCCLFLAFGSFGIFLLYASF